MSDIEIGEYVRTYFGEIGKCIDKSFESCVIDFNKEKYDEFFEEEFEEEILKHSFNVLDLIEIGDVVKVKDNDWLRILYADDKDMLDAIVEDILEENYKLLSILTHEQYEQNCYEIDTN